MEIADIVINRIEEESNIKKQFNTLIGFSDEIIGRALISVTELTISGKHNKPYITLLNLINEEKASTISDEEIYKSNLFSSLISDKIKDKITVRTLVKKSDYYIEDIIKVSGEYNCDTILLGIGANIFNSPMWRKYIELKTNNLVKEEDYIREFGDSLTNSLKIVASVLGKSDKSVGILVGANLNKLNNIFVPILKEEDILTLIYVNQMLKQENIIVTIWDAIGIIESNNRMQKMLSIISKKADGIIKLWNNDKKISVDFIESQDLMVIGRLGWDKLISTPLDWINKMPSTLIIKDKKR